MNRYVVRFLSIAAVMAGSSAAMADTLEQLQGAWVMEGTDCTQVFKHANGKTAFIDRDSSLATGLTVVGKQITTPEETCTVGKSKQDGDHVNFLLNCEDSVMFNTISTSFRMIDADTFERFETLFPDTAFTYKRCKF
jgi:predicted HAD superfamily Cof-like phosphohydrolase